MGGRNPDPGDPVQDPNEEPVGRDDAAFPGAEPIPGPPFRIKQEIRYLTWKSRLQAVEENVELRFEVESGSSDVITIHVPNTPHPLNVVLHARSATVTVTPVVRRDDHAIQARLTAHFPARFRVQAKGVGEPGVPAAILRFESIEQMQFNREMVPVLVCEVAVWIEPTRGRWIDGRGVPSLELGIVATHAVMFPGTRGSSILFWSPPRVVVDNIRGNFKQIDPRINGGFEWDLANTIDMETQFWSRHSCLHREVPMPGPQMGHGRLNLFCSGQVLLANGTAMMAGGHVAASASAGDHVITFDPLKPAGTEWKIEHGLLAGRRWYPTQTTLPSGRVLIVSGLVNSLGYFPRPVTTGIVIGIETIAYALAVVASLGVVAVAGAVAGVVAFLHPQFRDGLTQIPQDMSAVTQFDIYDPELPGLVTVPSPRPHLIRDTDMSSYPGVYVLPGAPLTELHGGAIFVHERRFGYLFWYNQVGNGPDSILPTDVAVPPGRALPAPPTISFMNSPGCRSWPWYAVTVLLPLDAEFPHLARILVAGGAATAMDLGESHPSNIATATAEIFDYDARLGLRGQTQRWRTVAPMLFRRILTDSTLLADGNVLVTGGASKGMANESGPPVFHAELFDSVQETWRTMDPALTERLYHSVALLLEDGTVFKAGSHGGLIPDRNNIKPQFHADIFQPPYLFRSPRPRVVKMPGERDPAHGTWKLQYDSTPALTVAVDDENREFRLALVRFGGITHGNYMDQRFVWLEIELIEPPHADAPSRPIPMSMPGPLVQPPLPRLRDPLPLPVGAGLLDNETGWHIHFKIPVSKALLPPGNYMLFVLNQYGVPSIGQFVVLGGTPPIDELEH